MLIIGPAALIGGLRGLLDPRSVVDGLESLLAVAVGSLGTTAVILYFLRPPTVPELPSLWEDIASWRHRRAERRRGTP